MKIQIKSLKKVAALFDKAKNEDAEFNLIETESVKKPLFVLPKKSYQKLK